jgi:multidrug efflux pump subunit AcrB
MPLEEACRRGARQVAGALLASTATTVAVFVPVLFLKDVEGQLFGDLALTISIAVAISVIAALTLLPAALSFALQRPLRASGYGQGWPRLTEWVLRVTDTRPRQLAWIAGLLLLPLLLAYLLLPPLDYLPPVKRAAIDSFFDFPPGMSPEVVNRELLPTLLERMRPYMEGRAEPRLKNWYIESWPGGGTIGARVVDERRIGELETLVRDKITVGLPDTRVFTVEGDLFGGIGGSVRSVGIHLQSEDGAALNRVAIEGRALLEKEFPGAAVQSFPNPEDVALELHAVPDDRRIAEVGWDRATVGTVVRTIGAGAWLGEYFDGKSRLPTRHWRRRQVRSCASATSCSCRPCSGPRRSAGSITAARSRSPSIRRRRCRWKRCCRRSTPGCCRHCGRTCRPTVRCALPAVRTA